MSVNDLGQLRTTRYDPRPALRGLLTALVDLVFALWARVGALAGVVLLAGYFAALIGLDIIRPVENWDTLAYIASAARDNFTTDADLHAWVYATAREAVSPEAFAALTQADAWRLRQFTDADAFVSMLGMYDVKWLYVQLIGVLAPVTGWWQAGIAINIAAALLMTNAVVLWLSANRKLHYAPLVAALLVVAGAEAFVMNSIPDFLAIALPTAGVLALDRGRGAAGATLLVLAVLTRPDSVAGVGVLLAAAWFFRDRMLPALGVAFAVSVAAYLFVQGQSHHPGWWPHLWFSTYKMQDSMAGFHPDFSAGVYLTAFAWNAARSVVENTWIGLYVLVLGAWAVMHARGNVLPPRRTMLLAALMAAIVAKFAIFPLHDARTYLPLLLPAMLLMLASLTVHSPKRDRR